MICGGPQAKAGKKISTATRAGKSSTASCRGKKKLNTNSLPPQIINGPSLNRLKETDNKNHVEF